ncbi:MAG: hypothetical protein ABWY71_01195 [Candidatus Saccharimonadales bacterium]
MAVYIYTQFGQAYGDGNYSACVYNDSTNCTAQSTGTSGNGSLLNTGVAISGVVTLACLLVLIAIVVRIWRRPAKPIQQEAPVVEDETNTNIPNDPS